MKKTTVVLFGIVSSLLFAGCVSTTSEQQSLSLPTEHTATPSSIPTLTLNQTPAASAAPKKGKYMTATSAVIKTAKGNIEIELYPKDAPKTVENFATHAQEGYYNGVTFHRVEPGFVIQGGDPQGTGRGGVSIFGDTFEDELNPTTKSYQAGYMEGVVAMANRGPNTNGSQFFIMLADNTSLPKAYTIFGKVTKGMDVVHNIAVGDKMISVEAK